MDLKPDDTKMRTSRQLLSEISPIMQHLNRGLIKITKLGSKSGRRGLLTSGLTDSYSVSAYFKPPHIFMHIKKKVIRS